MDIALDAPIQPPNRPAIPGSAHPGSARATGLAVAVIAALAATPALASGPSGPIALDPGTSSEASVWTRSFYKMLTYETVANASDVIILSALSGGIGSVGAGFLGANVASAATVY